MGISVNFLVQELPESAEHMTNTLPLGIGHSSADDDEQVVHFE